jgi:hypothetical protein
MRCVGFTLVLSVSIASAQTDPQWSTASPMLEPRAQHTATGDVFVSRIHPLLRMEPRRALCGQAADRRPASQSEVAGGADGAEAPHAHAGARAASLALQCAARARCLLRAAEQLATRG